MHVPRALASPGASRPLFVARRRRRVGPALVLGVVAMLLIWMLGYGRPMAASGDERPELDGQPPTEAEPEPPATNAAAQTPTFASFDGLDLHLPTSRPIVVGFHEASTDEALEMRPVGTVVENENTTKFEPPSTVEAGSDYLVLSSRGRVHAATSAVDVVMHPGDPVRSPVHGTVTDVRRYHLYGSHRDHRLEIAPESHPQLRIVLIHVENVHVEVGDVVVAGETMLAGSARPFPFGSQIDRYTEPDRWPHVHLEVKHEDDVDDEDD